MPTHRQKPKRQKKSIKNKPTPIVVILTHTQSSTTTIATPTPSTFSSPGSTLFATHSILKNISTKNSAFSIPITARDLEAVNALRMMLLERKMEIKEEGVDQMLKDLNEYHSGSEEMSEDNRPLP